MDKEKSFKVLIFKWRYAISLLFYSHEATHLQYSVVLFITENFLRYFGWCFSFSSL